MFRMSHIHSSVKSLRHLLSGYYRREAIWQVLALILACDYLAFRVELFSDEYEKFHPAVEPYSHQTTLTLSTLNWETFDKDNAPKAVSIVVDPRIELFLCVTASPSFNQPFFEPYNPIRDKSPPLRPSSI